MSEKDRVALITGGSGAIGLSIAEELAKHRAVVAIGYRKNREGAVAAAAKLSECTQDTMAVEIDVTDDGSVERAFCEVECQAGQITIVVNCAGVMRNGLALRISDPDWSEVIETNLTGTMRVCRRALRHMMRCRWGRIVNIGSVAAFVGSPGQANYAAAKAGLVGFSRCVAREMAVRGITCNVIAPGPIATPMIADLPTDVRAFMTEVVPAKRFGTPDEVGQLAAFLCSDAAGYINGAVIPVDGGLAMGT